VTGPHPYTLTRVTAPMAVWALHLVTVYSLEGLACTRGWPLERIAGMSQFNWLLVLVSLPALAVTAWLLALGWRDARTPSGAPHEGARRRRLLAWTMMALAAVATVAIVFATLPVFMLPPCTPEAH